MTQLADTLCRPDATWVIAANNGEATHHLAGVLQRLPHHALYPDAAVMPFNLESERFSCMHNEWAAQFLMVYDARLLDPVAEAA